MTSKTAIWGSQARKLTHPPAPIDQSVLRAALFNEISDEKTGDAMKSSNVGNIFHADGFIHNLSVTEARDGMEPRGRKLEADQGRGEGEWGQLTEDDLDVINGRRDQLEGKIQERYGLAKDQVRKDIDDWYATQRW